VRRAAGLRALPALLALAGCGPGTAVDLSRADAGRAADATATQDAGSGGAIGDAGPGGQSAPDAAPTPDATAPAEGRLVLNEAMPAAEEGGDWFEVVVVGPGSVRLAEYTVVDDTPGREPATLPDRTLEAGAFLRIHAGDDPPDGAVSVPFKLGRDDALALARLGTAVDVLRWGEAEVGPDRSVGRLPDAEGPMRSLRPTPGAPNQPLDLPTPLFDPVTLVPLAVTLTEADWAAFQAVPGPVEPVAATLVHGEDAPRAVTLLRDAVTGALVLDLDPTRSGAALDGHRRLEVHCEAADPTGLREVLALEAARAFGVPAPEAVLTRFRLQDAPETVCTLRAAVDADFLARRFGGGALLRVAPPASDLVYRGRDASAYVGLSALAPADAPVDDVVLLAAALNAGDPAAYPSVTDRDETLRTLVFQGAVADLSAYGGAGARLVMHSAAGRLQPVPMGMPGAFGGAGCTCADATTLPVLTPVCGPLSERPLIRRFQEPTVLREQALGALRELLDGPLAPETLEARIDAWAAVARTGPVGPDFERGLDGAVGERPGLRPFVRARAEALRAQLTGASPSAGPTGCVAQRR
jgi:hypothetical protein